MGTAALVPDEQPKDSSDYLRFWFVDDPSVAVDLPAATNDRFTPVTVGQAPRT